MPGIPMPRPARVPRVAIRAATWAMCLRGVGGNEQQEGAQYGEGDADKTWDEGGGRLAF